MLLTLFNHICSYVLLLDISKILTSVQGTSMAAAKISVLIQLDLFIAPALGTKHLMPTDICAQVLNISYPFT